ncbi:UNVERIFIED_CONTAM: protein STRUBBELIG-RECEPTOR FAMILY 8 [Sesamum radiatum]|uniref:Protein STRUBBELIG-RECEPTOR FAMILY 8 n=1 Tax=Sesamum radiatum TaxID=300843 RepID=A0AAW2LPL4_SESRA
MERQVAASSSLFFTELVVIAAVIFGFCAVADSATDPNDVQGLQVLYTSLNSPSQLTGWKASGGDPCGESWKGVTCQGSSVVSVQISGLGLSGTMGYLLNNLGSLKTLNLASNNLSGNLPYSISNMGLLNYLNISRNMLSQTVGDMFANHSALDTFQVQNNQLTGSLNVLVGLPLTNLNVANNHFTGWIPQELTSIPNFVYDGNAFANGPAPPPPPYTSPPPVFCLRRGNKKEIAARPSTGSLPVSSEKGSATKSSFAALQTATNSFSQENLIGEGSLGRVYRAEFPNGKIMAIKKVDSAALSLQEEDNFLEAISNMSRLRHPNIVALAGYCVEHGQRLLVHDYIGNGSLHDMLHFADERSKMLTWNARVRVALGTARALEYLHEVCLPSVVHRNLKSANILLDEELNPHLSDCGLAALGPNTERQVSSTQMIGSFGYSAPEFALSGIYTVKSDVYSFGVVMLELLTGRKPLDSSRVRSEQSLVRWATPQLHDIDALAKMVDPALNGMYPAKSLSRFADVIALCVQPEPEFRPPMSEVVQALVRLMQRASIVKRRSSEESGFAFKTPDHEPSDML